MLLLDIFKLIVLCTEHVDVSYNPRVSKMVEGIVDNGTSGAAGMEDGVIGVLDTWAMEVGGQVRTYVEGGLLEPRLPPGMVFPQLKTGARRGVAHRYKCPPTKPL